MVYKTTLIYTERVLREAVFAFWRRTIGVGFVIALIVAALALGVLLAQGNHSWFVGVLAAVLAMCVVIAAVLYAVHYRNSLGRFRAMGRPEATFSVDESTFTVSSNLGTTTLRWSAVKELWQFETVWLILYSKAQFSTLPLACMSQEMQEYVLQRVRSAGGSVHA